FTCATWGTTASYRVGDYTGRGRAELAQIQLGQYQTCTGGGDNRTCTTHNYYWPNNVSVGQGAHPDLLTGVTNELGGTTTVAYRPATADWHSGRPFVVQAVSSVTRYDGRGGTAKTGYSYAGGLWTAAERRFLGFQTATATVPCITGESACAKVVTTYLQSV